MIQLPKIVNLTKSYEVTCLKIWPIDCVGRKGLKLIRRITSTAEGTTAHNLKQQQCGCGVFQ